MKITKAASSALALLLVSAMLGGCSSVPETTTATSKDITNAVLTSNSGDCADYVASYESNVEDLKNQVSFIGQVKVTADSDSCSVAANDIPNYDFNDGTANWVNDVSEIAVSFNVPRGPKLANSVTELSLLNYEAVMLNGVVVDQVANGCYAPDDASADADGLIPNGCGLWVDWRLDPLGKVSLGADSHNAHTQPGGLYHYHGNPYALYNTEDTGVASPVIGFAADGFPIFGPRYVDPASGEVVEATSGYTIKTGSRPSNETSPGGSYDGTFIQDYEFTNAGTLDKCNGMTVNGQYGYYVTKSYPYILGCFSGTPDLSFFKFWEVAIWLIAALSGLLAAIVASIFVIARRRKRNGKNPETTKTRVK